MGDSCERQWAVPVIVSMWSLWTSVGGPCGRQWAVPVDLSDSAAPASALRLSGTSLSLTVCGGARLLGYQVLHLPDLESQVLPGRLVRAACHCGSTHSHTETHESRDGPHDRYLPR